MTVAPRAARRTVGRLTLAALVTMVAAASIAPAAAAAAPPLAGPSPHGPCDVLDTVSCLFPFPNDYFTVPDRSTATGRRVAFSPDAMPKSQAGVPIDPTEWNRNDGFSPGSAILTFVPGLDLARTGAARETDLAASLRPDAPIVLLDAVSRQRVPYWAEPDQSVTRDDQRTLIIRPARNFTEGHRIVVALRHLKDSAGAPIAAGAAFRDIRDRIRTTDPAVEARRPHLDQVLTALGRAGVARTDLFLAWDFTIASARNLAGRMLHIRDDAFRSLHGHAPGFQVVGVASSTDPRLARIVTGTVDAPRYLSGSGGPGSTFDLGPDGLPRRTGTLRVPFECIIPRAALSVDGTVHPARPAVYGHGLLGSQTEVAASNVRAMADEHDFVFCATKWLGLSNEDVPTVAATLQDLSRFPTIPDRLQQGILDSLLLGRLLKAPDGFASSSAFRSPAGRTVLDRRELFYDGNSLGGIMGGAATAVAPDWTRAVLGVPGMNFGLLLQRSRDYDAFRAVADRAYTNPIERTLLISLTQMLWDRGEADGYAEHLTGAPYPGTPRHTVLLHEAFGDFQVANVATEVEARTIGALAERPAITPGRSPDQPPLWGLATLTPASAGGSALVVWDSGTPAPPVGNTPPRTGKDPHEDPRAAVVARRQKSAFLRSRGGVIDVCGGQPCVIPHATMTG